ncbi:MULTISPECIES: long-chain-fatty-acid--CoA ligase [unclassified Roseitalea]|uniref:long-chain-fatty-acid--CoA ligase n=1 Tax=unclassified Roseitalea TaxID=2639107 RepID=UPI00274007B8|nr:MULTISPECIES: long-chain-fatty-acid--CoA ligase [unclassified Roseitalea]
MTDTATKRSADADMATATGNDDAVPAAVDEAAPETPAEAAAAGETIAPGNATTATGDAADAEKVWLGSYPEGTPAEIGPLVYTSIAEMLDECLARYANRTAFSCMGKAITYAELDAASNAFAAHLQSLGLEKGDRVALMMPNILQYPVAMAGVFRAGLTVVNVNPLYTPRELEHQLNDSGARAIVILENFAGTLQQVISNTPVEHTIVTAMGDLMGLKGHIVNLVVRRVKKLVPAWRIAGHQPFKTVLANARGRKPAHVEVDRHEPAFLQYTGGTTGISKGAVLTHANILSNIEQCRAWLDVGYRARGKPEQVNYVCALPLYHIFALTVNGFVGIREGGHNILIPNPRDIPAFVKELANHRFHFFPGLNTLFNALLNNEEFGKLDFSHLRMTFGGGMAVQRPVAERWQALTGCVITEGYGLSETSPVATGNRLDAAEFTGTIGLPLPSTEVSIRDDTGKALAFGEVGEICIRGPQVMAGYWNRPEETAEAMTADGFFRSGDMGFMDANGFTKIVDRKKDMILVSGFNVYPNEVEEVAAGCEGVVEAAAVGIADEHSGEAVKLFVVRADDSVTEEKIKAYCAAHLTNYKRPRQVEFRDSLPKTNVGKILRRELR